MPAESMELQVSVVVPVFDGAGSIVRALASIVAQTLIPIEIIAVDDASRDETAAIVTAFAVEHPSVRLLSLPHNRGVSAARNRGMAEARGAWVAFLDADDAFVPTRLSTLAALGESTQADIVADNLLYFDWAERRVVGTAFAVGAGGWEPVGALAFLERSITGRSPFDYSLLKPMVRRRLIREGRFRYPEGLGQGEDYMVLAEAILGGAAMALSHGATYLYTESVGRASRKPSRLSRTVADCREMRRRTLTLLQHPAVRADPRLTVPIRKRAAAITWYESWERIYRPLRERQAGDVLRALAKDWRASPLLLAFLGRRCLRL